ncbi:hypothetical protein M0R72_14200 [Candidatus Pacearchaeota archaeon]|nr:hypothetical protein [Candidatus Pacearchaeota archaeon]
MSLLENLPHLATAKIRTRIKDSLGGSKDSFDTILFTDKACWRQPANASEIKTAQHRDQVITHKVYFAEDPGLDEKCILVIGTDTMTVRSAAHPDASVGLEMLWRVMVQLDD